MDNAGVEVVSLDGEAIVSRRQGDTEVSVAVSREAMAGMRNLADEIAAHPGGADGLAQEAVDRFYANGG